MKSLKQIKWGREGWKPKTLKNQMVLHREGGGGATLGCPPTVSEVAAAAGLKLELCRPESIDPAGSLAPTLLMVLDNSSTTRGHKISEEGQHIVACPWHVGLRRREDEQIVLSAGIDRFGRVFFKLKLRQWELIDSAGISIVVFLVVVDNWSIKRQDRQAANRLPHARIP